MIKQRIQLAEAMGWKLNNWEDAVTWENPQGRGAVPSHMLPDPFTDANDDYAVLEWMRDQNPQLSWTLGDLRKANYMIGDYARAAISVLTQQGKS